MFIPDLKILVMTSNAQLGGKQSNKNVKNEAIFDRPQGTRSHACPLCLLCPAIASNSFPTRLYASQGRNASSASSSHTCPVSKSVIPVGYHYMLKDTKAWSNTFRAYLFRFSHDGLIYPVHRRQIKRSHNRRCCRRMNISEMSASLAT